MTDKSWTTKQLFPFSADAAELDGSTKLRGMLTFGTVPKEVCAPRGEPPVVPGRNIGWSPVIKSLSYTSLLTSAAPTTPVPGLGTAHDLTMQFVEKVLTERELQGTVGGLAQNQRWRQVFFAEVGIQVAYLVNIPVPVSEESGNPFSLRLITENRTGPSMAVCEYQWGRFVRDTSASGQRRLMRELVAHARTLAAGFIEKIRGES